MKNGKEHIHKLSSTHFPHNPSSFMNVAPCQIFLLSRQRFPSLLNFLTSETCLLQGNPTCQNLALLTTFRHFSVFGFTASVV
jgi:hypothetical protein